MRIDIAKLALGKALSHKIEFYEVLGQFNVSEYIVTAGPSVNNFSDYGQAFEFFKKTVESAMVIIETP